MIIGVPREIKASEFRVGLTPDGCKELTALGHEVLVEKDAAQAIGFPNEDYEAAGVRIVDTPKAVFAQAELIVKVKEPQLQECQLLREGQGIFTYLHLAAYPEIAAALISSQATCIAYETVTDPLHGLPLLLPMSIIAGRMSIQAAAHFLEITHGGSGVLLAGAPGVRAGKVVILGGGVVGSNAAQMAVGLGAQVILFDKNASRMEELEQRFGNRIKTLFSSRNEIEKQLADADVVIGAVLIPGAAAPKLVSHDMLKLMRRGTVLVDVAIDQGGCFATSKATTHADPVFVVDGIVHYCVANMPGAVPLTSTIALTNATLPFIIALAELGFKQSMLQDPCLRNGLNVFKGQVTHDAVARSLGQEFVDPRRLLSQAA